jgi:ribosomal protein S18 acetylase RimI-like enzyme
VITEAAFAGYQEQAAQSKHSSLRYAEYEDCRMSDEVYADAETLILCDFHQTPVKLDFTANDFWLVISQASRIENPLRINFVPYDFRQELLGNGFEVWAEFVDYFNLNLQENSAKRVAPEEPDCMKQTESEEVSRLSRRCAGQSRGFFGNDAAHYSKWTEDGNHILLIRDQGQIAGYCCVSVYAEGTTLWVREIAVDPDFQGRGYGRKLMEQAIGYGVAKGAVKGFLAVDTTNHRAISLYERFGFTRRNQEGELQMIRN